jgi:hypothetical protein
MAAQSKTTAVHFSLIFFVMLSVILGVVAYLFYSDYQEQQATYQKNQTELTAEQGLNKRYLEEIDALKKTIGIEQAEVGVAQPGDNTVIAQSAAAIQTLGTNPSAPSFYVALQDLRNELNKRVVEITERNNTITELQNQLLALKSQYDKTAAEHDQKRQATEQDLAGQTTKYDESIASKDKEIGGLRDQNAALQTELQQTKERMTTETARLQDEIRQLEMTNQKLNSDLAKIKGESYEIADGEIRRVDQVARTVWINLGSADNVRKRTTFSVYEKNNRGIGRDAPGGGRPEDIKGSVEVVRVIDDHLAEARILDDDSSRPIAPGDPIYSPIWNKGRAEQFAFVGKIDIDGDGSYVGDRERLHELLDSVGAKISSEVLDNGERVPTRKDGDEVVPVPIDEQTKFLVTGRIPAPESVPDGDERTQIKLMMQHQAEMEKEANRNGVRIINLNTFLDYIGYVPQQRRWVPGESKTWTLSAGARSGGVDDRPGTATSSSGHTSKLFDTRRARPTAPGRTSQSFGRTGTGY